MTDWQHFMLRVSICVSVLTLSKAVCVSWCQAAAWPPSSCRCLTVRDQALTSFLSRDHKSAIRWSASWSSAGTRITGRGHRSQVLRKHIITSHTLKMDCNTPTLFICRGFRLLSILVEKNRKLLTIRLYTISEIITKNIQAILHSCFTHLMQSCFLDLTLYL